MYVYTNVKIQRPLGELNLINSELFKKKKIAQNLNPSAIDIFRNDFRTYLCTSNAKDSRDIRRVSYCCTSNAIKFEIPFDKFTIKCSTYR